MSPCPVLPEWIPPKLSRRLGQLIYPRGSLLSHRGGPTLRPSVTSLRPLWVHTIRVRLFVWKSGGGVQCERSCSGIAAVHKEL